MPLPTVVVVMNAMPVVLEGAHKSYGSVEALKDVDLSIAEGEVVAILGPNGAGKTTAINLMLGLRKPTQGRARLFGLDPGDRRARSRCGVMLQESGVLSSLHVRELVGQFRSYYPNPMSVDRAIAMAGLEAEADRQSAKLSGGQRQRLYYALAVCGDPDLLFLDEPTVGMDVESRRAFLAEIRAFAALGRTVVLTTHYLEEADELAQRVIVIDRGSVIADGSPGQIKARVGGRRITFDCPGGLGEGDVAGLPVQSLEVRGTRAWMLSDEPEEVLRALFERGVRMQNLEVVGADLEEAFVSLTSHDRDPGEKVAEEVGA
jgi:ABC-2 type transport system ATP-binding protein